MRPFLVCIHDATPAHARETRAILGDLAPLLGRRLSVGVVPNWHGAWPVTAHPEYCRLLLEGAEELLLHGFFHQRQQGAGAISLLTDRSDEMNGLNPDETRRSIECGQRMFTEVFGTMPRGFLAPAWQRGHVGRPEGRHYDIQHHDSPTHHDSPRHHDSRRHHDRRSAGLQAGLGYVLGFFSLESRDGLKIPLATWSWDCGRWGWLGHVGHAIGQLSYALDGRVPTLAIHPRDLERGFWPTILRLTEDLLENGYEPSTPARLLESFDCAQDRCDVEDAV